MYTANKIETFRPACKRGYRHSRALFIFCLLCAINAALPNKSLAEIYYCDPVGGDTQSNSGSSASPWGTLQSVFQAGKIQRRTTPTGSITNPTAPVAPGDTIKLRTGYHGVVGEYNGWRNNEGPITIEADVGHNPSLGYIHFEGASNWIFRNLTIRPEFAGIYKQPFIFREHSSFGDSHHTILENCDLSTASDATVSSWSASEWANNAKDGIQLRAADSIARNNNVYNVQQGILGGGENTIIENNAVNKFTMDGLRFWGGDNMVWQYNTVKNSLNVSDNHDDGMQIYVATSTVSGLTIRGNRFYCYADPSIPYSSGAQGIFAAGGVWQDWTVENNLLVVDHWHGISIYDPINSIIINNTVVHPPNGAHGPAIRVGSAVNTIIRNNLVWGGITTGSGITVENNLENVSTNYDDIFTDWDGYDFTLKAGSPAIDTGSADLAPDIDILGNSRPLGAGYDIGAYEYLSGPPDTTQPSIPQNLTAQAVSESQIDLSWDASSDPESGVSYYKIYRAGSQIDTSVSTSYSNIGLNGGTTYSYEVSAVNGQGLESDKSNIASETTFQDTTPPSIVSVSASETSVEITFSESLDITSAEDTSNYGITGGISVSITAASLDTDTVTLTTSAHTEGTYTLTVENVQDTSGNPMTETTTDYEYDDGLVGYWKFDDGSGNSAVDSSGNSNTGTLINGPTWATGRVGGALSFDGVDDAVEIGTDNLNGSSGTIVLWAYAESFSSSHQTLFGHVTQPWSNRIQLYTDDASGNLDLGLGDSHTRHTDIENLDTQKWYHIALAWDGSNYTVYANGSAQATGSYSGLSTLETYADIGNNGDRADRTEAFHGIIDEVRIYNRPLNTAEVLELYNAGASVPVTHTLGVTAVNGSVTKTPDKASYNHGEEVTLQAVHDPGYSFVNWTGGVTGSSNPATIIMDADKSVTANFAVNTYTLTITAVNGSVTKTPDKASYNHGGEVTLQAVHDPGCSFVNWAGGVTGSSNPATIVMDADKSVTATFAINTYTLNVTAVNGSITKTPDKASYNYGEEVTLQAVHDPGYSFVNWAGGVTGSSNPATIIMDADKSVTANFAVNTYTLTVTAVNGSITKTPDKATYNHGEEVTLQAVHDPGYSFVNWTGGVTGSSNPATIIMDADKSVTANFVIDEIDETAPVVTNCAPAADSIQAPLNTLIILHVVDDGKGVDPESVTIEVDDNLVYSGNTTTHSSIHGKCHRIGTKADYTFIYQPKQNFELDESVRVKVKAKDLASNTMAEYSYSFKTEMLSFGKNTRVDLRNIKKGRPVTVCDNSGNIWAAWHAGVVDSRDIYIGKLEDGAVNFDSSVQLTSDAAECNPVTATGSDGKLYVAWQDNRNGNWDIYVSTSNDWSAEIRVTGSDANQINPAIVVDSSNNASIVWEDDRNGNQDIYVAKSSDGFATKAVSPITSDTSDQVEPAIAVDSDNTIYVVWTDTRIKGKKDIYGAASNNGPWTNIPVVAEEDGQSSPAIATEAVGSILHLVWVDDRTTDGDDDIFYAKTTGGLSPLTGSSIIDDDTGADQISPVIITTGTGNDLKVFACWRDERWANADLYFAEISPDYSAKIARVTRRMCS